MLVSNLLNFTPQINNTRPIVNSVGYSRISFGNQIINDTADLSFSRGLNKFKDFSVEEYKTLTEDEIDALRVVAKKHLPTDDWIRNHDIISDNIKDYLDNKYGEGRYKVITIGRSLSSIGQVLGYKIGEDNVINIPMSEAGKYNSRKAIKYTEKYGTAAVFNDFLESQGLTKEEIECSDKKYIIMDYCHTGESLKGAKRLLTRDSLLGKKNIYSLDVMDCISDKKFAKVMEEVFYNHLYKGFALVEKTPFLHDAAGAVIDKSKADTTTKLGWFRLLDDYMTKPKEENRIISVPSRSVHIRNSIRKILMNLYII